MIVQKDGHGSILNYIFAFMFQLKMDAALHVSKDIYSQLYQGNKIISRWPTCCLVTEYHSAARYTSILWGNWKADLSRRVKEAMMDCVRVKGELRPTFENFDLEREL